MIKNNIPTVLHNIDSDIFIFIKNARENGAVMILFNIIFLILYFLSKLVIRRD